MAGAGAALPVELDLDAVVAVGVDGLAGHADDDRRLRTMHGRARVQARVGQAVVVETSQAHRHGSALGADAARVQRLVALVREGRVGKAAGHLAEEVVRGVTSGTALADGGDGTEQRLHLRALVGADVAPRNVAHGQRHEAVAVVVEAVVGGVVAEREGRCRGGAAHGAAPLGLRSQRIDGLHLSQGQARALGCVFIGVGGGYVVERELA